MEPIEELIEKLRGDCSSQRMAEHCGSLSTVEVAPGDLERLFEEIACLKINVAAATAPLFSDPPPAPSASREMKVADRKRVAAQERAYLSDLLALIHRDGGHYEEEVGCKRAFHHAVAKLQRIYLPACDNPTLGAEIARLRQQIDRLSTQPI